MIILFIVKCGYLLNTFLREIIVLTDREKKIKCADKSKLIRLKIRTHYTKFVDIFFIPGIESYSTNLGDVSFSFAVKNFSWSRNSSQNLLFILERLSGNLSKMFGLS